jgi:hypothetical protein
MLASSRTVACCWCCGRRSPVHVARRVLSWRNGVQHHGIVSRGSQPIGGANDSSVAAAAVGYINTRYVVCDTRTHIFTLTLITRTHTHFLHTHTPIAHTRVIAACVECDDTPLLRCAGMRLLVMSLLQSMPALMNVILLMAFIFAIFGILGLQVWCVVFFGLTRVVGGVLACALRRMPVVTCLPSLALRTAHNTANRARSAAVRCKEHHCDDFQCPTCAVPVVTLLCSQGGPAALALPPHGVSRTVRRRRWRRAVREHRVVGVYGDSFRRLNVDFGAAGLPRAPRLPHCSGD